MKAVYLYVQVFTFNIFNISINNVYIYSLKIR
jgi:hypothetical protein